MTTIKRFRKDDAPAQSAPKPRPKMNGAEKAYAMVLEARKRIGEVWAYEFAALTLKLADDVRYTPDFLVWSLPSTGVPKLELHEVKGGFIRDDARVKLRCAAQQFPMFTFRQCQYVKGSWTITEINTR